MENIERIRSLESSREVSRGKLKMLFRKCEELESALCETKSLAEQNEKRINLLLGRIDCEIDKLILFEREVEVLKKKAHTHNIVM